MLINHLLPCGTLTDAGSSFWRTLSINEKLDLLFFLRSVRMLDRRMVLWQRQGKIGTYAPVEGQEAAQVGSAYALDKKDWVFPSYREQGVAFTFGISTTSIIQYWSGRIEGCKPPIGYRYVPPTVPIATQLPHAVGAAWSIKKKKETGIAIAYFGDGATSEGDFHEALNFASIFDLPVLFFCQNNGYAISVPFAEQSATKTVVEKASAYGINAYQVDGNDVLAVYHVVKTAKSKRKPALIEAVTYRTGAHTTADDASRYRPEGEVRIWLNRDPLYRYEQLCLKEGLLDEDQIEKQDQQVAKELDRTMREVEKSHPNPSSLFTHVYHQIPDWLKKQQEEAANDVNHGSIHC
ncbi:thiamine pyrophosphate-dependent dehydrogenase E1 component subunit alpha [Shimazuella kribbensis]|uniref:thiamine pyrophosphate-dependent dehydrogenase E1 component subunit alpha n=1 Tax=Shimazuella kribbensis TaxID=139808 RepID=UPI00040618F3|nr:thiamine pyrophosphate-dependent dehydrogenase E1 component subunit alpha [Shimazuella kribbensis]